MNVLSSLIIKAEGAAAAMANAVGTRRTIIGLDVSDENKLA